MLRLLRGSLCRRGFPKRSHFLRRGLGGEPVQVLGRAVLKSLFVITPIQHLLSGTCPLPRSSHKQFRFRITKWLEFFALLYHNRSIRLHSLKEIMRWTMYTSPPLPAPAWAFVFSLGLSLLPAMAADF